MQSLVLCSYKQPMAGAKFRWGVLRETRDTKKIPLNPQIVTGKLK